MQVQEFLKKSGAQYSVHRHPAVYSAQGLAAVEHESGKHVAKPVIIRADGRYVMCVIAACHKLDMVKLKHALGALHVELAYEQEFPLMFPDCEVGAEPPLGNLYEMETIMDIALTKDDQIVFQGGRHTEAIHMRMADYYLLAQPRVQDIRYH